MTDTSTSLGRAASGRGETRRFLAFVRRPVLPERPAGFSGVALGAIARLYLLDVALMAVLIGAATAVVAAGVTLPSNEINSLKLDGATVALIVLLAPVLEELIFRSWLSGRPGHLLAALAVMAGAGAAVVLPDQPAKLASVGAGLLAAAAAVALLRGRPAPRWFARAFPGIYYAVSLLFALAHMANFTEGAWLTLLPLVVPQLLAGAIFGYARVTYGLWANVLLHILHNGTAIGLVLLANAAGVATA